MSRMLRIISAIVQYLSEEMLKDAGEMVEDGNW